MINCYHWLRVFLSSPLWQSKCMLFCVAYPIAGLCQQYNRKWTNKRQQYTKGHSHNVHCTYVSSIFTFVPIIMPGTFCIAISKLLYKEDMEKWKFTLSSWYICSTIVCASEYTLILTLMFISSLTELWIYLWGLLDSSDFALNALQVILFHTEIALIPES